jgi:hypothetical protein
MYRVYELIVESEKRYLKKSTLTNLDIEHEKLRMLIYLAKELGYFKYSDGKNTGKIETEIHRFLAISKLVDELGKIIGGWIKTCKANPAMWK